MSGLDQRAKARAAEGVPNTAVGEGTASSQSLPWPPIERDLLAGEAPGDRRPGVPDFPLDLLPQPWRDWSRDAQRFSGAPVDYVVQAVLASVAAIAGRRVAVLPTPGWQEPLRLWLAAVGSPATGKSPALETVGHLLEMLHAYPVITHDR